MITGVDVTLLEDFFRKLNIIKRVDLYFPFTMSSNQKRNPGSLRRARDYGNAARVCDLCRRRKGQFDVVVVLTVV